MTEQSQFSKLPKKTLVRISEKIIDDGFDSRNPYTDYNENYKILETIGKYFSMPVNDEDVQFFAKFITDNDDLLSEIMGDDGDKTLMENLVIPEAKTYELRYNVWGHCSYDEFLAQKFDAYDKFWVRDSADQQLSDGNWSLYDGYNTSETQYDNHEMSNYEYYKVVEVDGDESVNLSESILDRLVIENTSEVVSSLDKQTLLKLREIINSRLRSL